MTLSSDPTMRRWAQMFADHDANIFDLPADLTALRAALEKVGAEAAAHATRRPDPRTTTAEVIERVKATAAGKSKTWPDVAGIREATDALTDHDNRAHVLSTARQQLTGQLADLIAERTVEIVTDYLRPVHARHYATVVKAADLIPDPTNTDALLRLGEEARTAWLDLDAAVTALGRIRDAVGRLQQTAPIEHDNRGEFALIRTGVRSAWPEWQVGRPAPWEHADPRQTYLDLARRGADVWLPTHAERDAAWWAAHGEEVRAARSNRHQLEGYRQALA